MSFSDLEQTAKKKQTRREIFLAEMDQVMPWAQLEAVIEPVYPKAGNGRRPYLLASMLRIYCLQQWYSLSDPAMEEALYEIASMRRFAGIDLNRVPDETTMLNFRHLLEEHKLTQALFDVINKHLADKGLLLKQGTIVDATLIHAPSSTKNASGERDPEMHQTKKGNQWYFGMKAQLVLMPILAWFITSRARQLTWQMSPWSTGYCTGPRLMCLAMPALPASRSVTSTEDV